MIDFASRLRWTSWAGVGFVLIALYGPFAVGRWDEYLLPSANIAALSVVVGVWLVSGVRLATHRADRPTALVLIAVCAGCLGVVTTAVPPDAQTGGLNWAFGSFGWFVFLLSTARPGWLVATALALPTVMSLVLLATYEAATAPAVAALLIRGCVVAGPQLILIFAAAQLQRHAAEAAAAAHRRQLLVSADEVGAALDVDRRRRVDLVRSSIGPVLRQLSTNSWSTDDDHLHHRCLVAASRVRRLLAESHAGEDPLVYELGAGLDELQRHGLIVDVAVRGDCEVVVPVELRRRMTDPLLDLVACARSRARVTVTRTRTHVRVSVTADVPHPGETGPVPADADGVVTSRGRYGEKYWMEIRCSLI